LRAHRENVTQETQAHGIYTFLSRGAAEKVHHPFPGRPREVERHSLHVEHLEPRIFQLAQLYIGSDVVGHHVGSAIDFMLSDILVMEVMLLNPGKRTSSFMKDLTFCTVISRIIHERETREP
jgi:hypothetical protein